MSRRYNEPGMSARAFMADFSSVAPSYPSTPKRPYSANAADDAAEIAAECIRRGSSKGWSGSIEQCEAIKTILAPLNIFYADDMLGEWRVRGAR